MPTIPEISLSESQQERLVKQLKEMISLGEEYHSQWTELHEIYERQYHCQPDSDSKNFPWLNASNLYLPLGRVIQDGIMAQLHDAMFGNDPIVKVKATKGRTMAQADILSMFYGDYVFKKVINMRRLGNDWNFGSCLDGTAVIRPRWSRERQLRRDLIPVYEPIYGESTQLELFGVEAETEAPIIGMRENLKEEISIVGDDKPVIDLHDLSHLYVAPDTVGSLQWPDCKWYFTRQWLTWSELVGRKQMGYANIDAELKANLSKRDKNEIERARTQAEQLSDGTTLDTIELIEFYTRLVLPAEYEYEGEKIKQKFMGIDEESDEVGEGYGEEVIITYFPRTGKIARIVPLWRVRSDGKRPDIANWYNRIPHRFYGQGIQAKMRHLNHMLNSGVNQMIDYGTLQNMPFYFYVPHMVNMPDLMSITPGQGIPVADPRGIQFPRMQGDTSFWLAIEQMVKAYGERDGQISDQSVGRLPEKSANKTARGMMLVQQLASIGFRRLASLMSESYLELLYGVHSLYKRNAPPEIIFKVTDEQGANFEEFRLSRNCLMQEVDFEMVLNPDRQQEQQIAQALFELTMSIPYIAQNPFSVRAAAKHLYDTIGSGSGRRNFNEIWPESMTPQIVAQQQQQAVAQSGQPAPFPQQPPQGAQMGGMPPQAGASPMGPTSPQMQIERDTEINEEEIGVKL
ncbi:MAG: hypothetical protein ABIH23_10115 [bacterium]